MPAAAADNLTPENARQLSAEVFVGGFPLVLMDAVRRSHPIATSRFRRLPPDAGDLAGGLAPHDPCTLQSSALIDLADDPVVLHLPDMRGRYFSLTLIDAAGEAFASLGSRTGDNSGADIALAGPRWRGELAGNVRARRAPSDLVWAVSRIVAHSRADMAHVEALAARQRIVPLRKALEANGADALLTLEPADLPAAQEIASLAPETYFHRLGQLVERAPAAVKARVGPGIAQRLARLGPPSEDPWPETLRQALSRGFADGLAQVLASARSARVADAGGWLRFGQAVQDGPLARAARALAFLGGPAPEDVLVLACDVDESGRPLSGEERYRIHLPAGAAPPAESAWRLSCTGLDETPYGVIGDHNDLGFNRDGSLELLIQAAAPEAGRPLNWLAAPPGPFRLTLRLYWPSPAALSGAWRMAPVERLGSRFARRSGPRLSAPRPRTPTGPRPRGASFLTQWITP